MGRTKELFAEIRQLQQQEWEQAQQGFKPYVEAFINSRKKRREIEEFLEEIKQDEAQHLDRVTADIIRHDKYYRGVSFVVTERANYNYSVCPEYRQLEGQLKKLKDELKKIGDNARQGREIFNSETGEQLTAPEFKGLTTAIQLRFNTNIK